MRYSYTLYLPFCGSNSPSVVIQVMCPAHFDFVLVSYWTMSVTLVLCLIMVLRILSFSLTFSIFLSVSRWLVATFFTNYFVRNHVWHPYIIAGKTHWLKTFLFRLTGRCLSRKILLYFPKKKPTPSCFHSHRRFLPCSVFSCFCLSHIFIVSHLLYSCPSICVLSVVSILVINWGGGGGEGRGVLYVACGQFLSFLQSRCLTDVPYLSHLLLWGLHHHRQPQQQQQQQTQHKQTGGQRHSHRSTGRERDT